MDATALYKFSSGLYVVSAATQDDYGACVINTGLQLTSTPLQVQVVVNKQNHTEGVIERAGHFALTAITEEATMQYIGRFGFRTSTAFAKFEGITCEHTVLGDPFTPECAACVLACKVVQTLDVSLAQGDKDALQLTLIDDARRTPLRFSITLSFGTIKGTLK